MKRRQRAFTMIEVLVAVGVVSVLSALLMPLVQNARENSRRVTCTDNLRQLGMAMSQYLTTHKVFPPGQISAFQKLDSLGRYADAEEAKSTEVKAKIAPTGQSWAVLLLSHIGQESLAQQWNYSTSVKGNADVAQKDISRFYCPSRRGSMGASGRFSVAERVEQSWRGGGNDYSACTGSAFTFKDDDDAIRQTYWLTPQQIINATPPGSTSAPVSQSSPMNGVFGVNSRVQSSDLTSGTSSTILLAERRIFTSRPGVSGNLTTTGSTDNQRRSSDGWAFGGPATSFSTRLAPQPPGPRNGRHFDEAGSEHPLGVNVLIADGTVKFLSYNIDLRTWNHLGTLSQSADLEGF